MKHVLKIVMLLCGVLMLASCHNDFDEWNDTDQRHVVFAFNTDSLFTKLLCYDGDYFIPYIDTLPPACRLRITAYCYDSKGNLVHSEHILTSLHPDKQIKIRHLLKGNTYRVAFVADVVRYSSDVDYYETWYQLGASSWSSLYIYADERNPDAQYNVIGYATFFIEPNNQTQVVDLEPITYNGYCHFTQLSAVDRFSGYILPCIAFKLSTLTYWKFGSLGYEFDYRNPVEDIVMPVSLCCADSIIMMQLITNSLSGIDTSYLRIPNPERRMFVATIDGLTHQLDTCIFY